MPGGKFLFYRSRGYRNVMVKRKKPRKKKIVEHEVYQIAMEDWEVYYSFGVDHRDYSSGVYWEISNLILMGKILSPELKSASKAKVTISADPEQEDHWSKTELAQR